MIAPANHCSQARPAAKTAARKSSERVRSEYYSVKLRKLRVKNEMC